MISGKYYTLMFILWCLPVCIHAQTYADTIQQYRQQYIRALLAEKRRPVSASEINKISFFRADHNYCVWADVTPTIGSQPFLVPTHSGRQKPFKEYGVLAFYLDNVQYRLHAYQMMDAVSGVAMPDELFVPFNDLTNYVTTYGGGRYIDLSVKDIHDHKLLLDFNKCYNPYCAYSDGFSCPVPPTENRLQVEIKAGEKVFPR